VGTAEGVTHGRESILVSSSVSSLVEL
jgi:hypothetical protein